MQGATATVSLRQPRTEAHLSQLAVLENFAEHGLYVKFSNQEAEELEREALALALEESTQEVGTDRGQSGLSPEPYSQDEAERVAAQLMNDAPPNVPSNGKRRGSFKGLFGFKDKNKKDKHAQLVASQPLPGMNARPAVAPPPPAPMPPSPQKKSKQAPPKKGIFQSARGREGYDSALVDARGLRAELERGVGQFRARTDALVKQMNRLQSRLQKAGPSVQAVDELKQSQIQVETAEVQLDVIEEGIDELCNLEKYLARTHPPYESAELLAHEVVRQLLACLSHVGVSSKILQASPLQGSRATKPDQRAERLVNHFRRESRSETPKPLPSLPDIPEEAQELEDAQDGTAEDSVDAAAEPQTPPRQSASKAFVAEFEDGSRQSVGAVEAKPLPAQAATVPVPQAAAQEAPVPSRPHVSIVEAKPLPARRTMPPAPAAPAAEDGQASSAALREHALLDISSPATSMPDGSSKPSTIGSAPASHDASLGSDASDTAAEHDERPGLLHEAVDSRAADSAAVPPGPSAAAKEATVPSAESKSESPSKDLWADPVQSQQAALDAPEAQGVEALPEISQQEAAKQVAIPAAHGNGNPDAQHGEVKQALSKDSPSEDASQKRKKRMAFGSLFKRKSPQANGSQKAPMPAEGVIVMPSATDRVAAQPVTGGTPSAADNAQNALSASEPRSAQQPAAASQPQAEPEDDAVGRAAAVQLRQATQQPTQAEAAAKPAAADTALPERGSIDAAVAKQSGISAKLAGASVPHLHLPPAAQRAESPAEDRSGDAGALTPRADGSTGEAASAEATRQPSQGGAAARASAVRSRVRSAGARQRKGALGYGESSSSAAPQQLHHNDEVDGLFKELDNVLPNNFMSQMFGYSSVQPVPGRPPSSKLTQAQKELAEQDAQKHAGLVQSLSKEIGELEAPNMASLVEYVRNTSARLGVIMTDEAAVLAQFPTWPQGKWSALRDAADAFSELSEFARREKQWLLQRGTCEEEVQRIEAFLDTVMGRTQGAAQRVAANEALWKGQGIPWDAAIFTSVRANSLHLATLYMSRVLFEVASLERSEDTVQEACLRHLAASVRAAHKIHGFAGGFDAELSALFDKVKRLAKYYVRILGPSPRHP